MKPAAVVQWWCDVEGRACLLVEVSAASGGPVVQFRRNRMSLTVADRAREGDRERGELPQIPLADLHRRGAFGPVACKHHVIVSLSASDLQSDYDQGIAERQQIRKYLHP